MKSLSTLKRMTAMLLTALSLLPGIGRQMAMGQQPEARMATFTSQLGRFTVLLPGQPAYKSSPVSTKAGVLTLHSYTAETRGGDYSYTIMFNDYPAAPTNIKSFFDRVRDGAAEGKRLVKEVELDLNGYHGRGMVIEDQKFRFIVADYLVGARLYQLIFAMPADEEVPATVGQFFKSFGFIRA